VERLLQLIRDLAAAETDRERTALQAAIAAELRAATPEELTTALAGLRDAATELATQDESEANVVLLETYATQFAAVQAALAGRSDDGSQSGGDSLADRAAAARAAFDEHPGTHDPGRDQVQPAGEGDARPPAPAEGAGTGTGQNEGDQEGQQQGTEGAAGGTEGGQQAGAGLGGLNRRNNNDGGPNTITLRTFVDGDVPGFTAGATLTRDQLTEAFRRKAMALNSAGAAGRHTVARVEFTYPEAHVLTNDGALNEQRLDAARRPESLTAAAQSGGLCLPLQVLYDIATVGVTDRPIRDSLTPFQVQRGALQYRLPFDALTMTEGLGVWGQDNDQSVTVNPDQTVTYEAGNDTQGNAFGPKTCFIADCPGVVEASIYSTYLCLEFPNMTARFDPEWVRAINDSAGVAHARFSENQIWSRLLAASKIVYAAPSVGAGAGFSAIREMLASYDKVISYYRSRHRLNDTVSLSTILPQWVIQMIATDAARMMNTSGDITPLMSIGRAQIESWFATRNVRVTWHLDGLAAPPAAIDGITPPAQFYDTLAAGQHVPGWPNAVDSLLYITGEWLLLDGGTLDLGLVRDSQLNMRNRYQTFAESFEGVAFRGLESLRVVMPLVPNGASSGTIAPPATTDGMAAFAGAA
jgi:hypothetical protein